MHNRDPIDCQLAVMCSGHKCKSFDEAPLVVLDARARVLTELRHYEPSELYDEPYILLRPTATFGEGRTPSAQYFVLELDEQHWYLVDRSGYDYCRRIARVIRLEMD